MAILDWLHDRFEFCFQAVKEEYKRSRWYKLMSILTPLYTIFGLVVVFQNPIPAWSWTTRIIVLQSSLMLALFLVVEAIYRSAKRTEKAQPEITVLVPTAFVRPVPYNRTVCEVFVRVELENPTPHRANLTKYLLDFKVKEKPVVRLIKLLDLEFFLVCNTIETYDDEVPDEPLIKYTDCEEMDDLRTVISKNGPPEDGFPAIGWLGFVVRKSVLPYTKQEVYTGRTCTVLNDDGEPEEIPETDYLYEPQFSAIEEIKVIIVDGHQNSWEGIASNINPRGEAVIQRMPLP